ncbi:hypothetical protein DFH09DRAFT_1103731 [Mycena vulgaris]|nr:hypothetical protein DFH09DRAFT_1103731 [Mycena vulgaris]
MTVGAPDVRGGERSWAIGMSERGDIWMISECGRCAGHNINGWGWQGHAQLAAVSQRCRGSGGEGGAKADTGEPRGWEWDNTKEIWRDHGARPRGRCRPHSTSVSPGGRGGDLHGDSGAVAWWRQPGRKRKEHVMICMNKTRGGEPSGSVLSAQPRAAGKGREDKEAA